LRSRKSYFHHKHTEYAEQRKREARERRDRDAKAGFWQKIIFDLTPEVRFTEAKSSERRKIEGKRLLAAANDDGPKWESANWRRERG
jgi:hypothetical protein